jgi:hypothetical protein
MTTKEIVIALTIHLVLPLVGLLYFLHLRKKMNSDNVLNAPTIELFLIFATYGGLLLLTLTTLFWKWSGMASLGAFYLIIGAPIIMGTIAYRHRQTKTISKYHKLTYLYGLSYFVIAPLTFLFLSLVSEN